MGTIYTAQFDSPIGELRVATSEAGLAYVALPRANGSGLAGWHRRHASEETLREGYEANRRAIAQITEFLEGKRKVFELDLDARGTEFQRAVWTVVAAIPYGASLTYAEVARRIDRPTAVRAVGAANGANPLSLVVPCHRVLASNGHLHGYAGGLELKARLLAMEGHTQPGQGRLF
jgi:O-6-methylguanine DNA methyltransferase